MASPRATASTRPGERAGSGITVQPQLARQGGSGDLPLSLGPPARLRCRKLTLIFSASQVILSQVGRAGREWVLYACVCAILSRHAALALSARPSPRRLAPPAPPCAPPSLRFPTWSRPGGCPPSASSLPFSIARSGACCRQLAASRGRRRRLPTPVTHSHAAPASSAGGAGTGARLL